MFQSITHYFKRFNLLIWIVGLMLATLLGWFFLAKLFNPVMKNVCKTYFLEQDDDGNERIQRIISVEVQPVKTGPINKRIHTVGTLRGSQYLEIKSAISGRVKELPITGGMVVNEGDVLIAFDDAELKAQLTQYEALHKYHKAEFERINSLRSRNIESEKKQQEAESQMDQYKGKVEETKVRIGYSLIKAPFSGAVSIPKVTVGDYVQQGSPLFVLVQNTPVQIDAKIPEQHFADVGPGQEVEVHVGALKSKAGFDKPLIGVIIAVEPKSDADSHSIAIRAQLPNDDGYLQHGMYCSLDVITGEKTNAIYVDEAAVETSGQKEHVWVIDRLKARPKEVLTGAREKGEIEILAGLTDGELVVTSGQSRLQNGCTVKILGGTTKKEREEIDKEKEKKP